MISPFGSLTTTTKNQVAKTLNFLGGRTCSIWATVEIIHACEGVFLTLTGLMPFVVGPDRLVTVHRGQLALAVARYRFQPDFRRRGRVGHDIRLT
jgi:hypothetical protein